MSPIQHRDQVGRDTGRDARGNTGCSPSHRHANHLQANHEHPTFDIIVVWPTVARYDFGHWLLRLILIDHMIDLWLIIVALGDIQAEAYTFGIERQHSGGKRYTNLQGWVIDTIPRDEQCLVLVGWEPGDFIGGCLPFHEIQSALYRTQSRKLVGTIMSSVLIDNITNTARKSKQQTEYSTQDWMLTSVYRVYCVLS